MAPSSEPKVGSPSRLRRGTDAFNRVFTKVHNRVYTGSRGWVGHRWTMVPSLVLHTVGRRTGASRSAVVVYAKDGESYLVVPSNFGKDTPPGWLVNMTTRPEAEINVGHRRITVTPEIVMPDDARYERLFEIADTSNRRRFERYRSLTKRQIPVVVLHPVSRT